MKKKGDILSEIFLEFGDDEVEVDTEYVERTIKDVTKLTKGGDEK